MPSALPVCILKMVANEAQSITLDHFCHFTLFVFKILSVFGTAFEKSAPNHLNARLCNDPHFFAMRTRRCDGLDHKSLLCQQALNFGNTSKKMVDPAEIKT